MQTYHPKNIRVGQVELVYCGTDKKPCWAVPGMGYEANEQKARALAKRINDKVSGRAKREKHI
ncbi:MAG: DUF1317 family protein [Marinomonas gallaica]